MINIEHIISGIEKFVDSRITILTENNAMLSLAQPFIKRGVKRQLDKYTGQIKQYLALVADEDGNIELDSLMDEVTTRFNEMPTTTVHNDLLGDVKLGQGVVEIEVSLPYMAQKTLTFTAEDITDLKNIIAQH